MDGGARHGNGRRFAAGAGGGAGGIAVDHGLVGAVTGAAIEQAGVLAALLWTAVWWAL